MPRAVYLLAPPGGAPLSDVGAAGRDPVVLARAADLEGRAPGVVLLHPELAPAEVLAALRLARERPGPWLLLLAEPSGGSAGGHVAVPVSLGWPADPEVVARWAAGAADVDLLDLRHVLARLARARHDLNNPLTSALAETQLALLDAKDPELRAGLETIEEQLRRMRDLIADLRGLRPPD